MAAQKAWAKPNVGRVGTAPPPASKARLQRLSQVKSLAQVGTLTPSPRPPAPRVQPGLVTASPAPPVVPNGAADKYIAEREQKRSIGFDIPKHARYTAFNAGPVSYAGSRQVDGQMLALLQRGDEVLVLEVDDTTARRLKRMPMGTQVGVNAQGVIRKKGRSR